MRDFQLYLLSVFFFFLHGFKNRLHAHHDSNLFESNVVLSSSTEHLFSVCFLCLNESINASFALLSPSLISS